MAASRQCLHSGIGGRGPVTPELSAAPLDGGWPRTADAGQWPVEGHPDSPIRRLGAPPAHGVLRQFNKHTPRGSPEREAQPLNLLNPVACAPEASRLRVSLDDDRLKADRSHRPQTFYSSAYQLRAETSAPV